MSISCKPTQNGIKDFKGKQLIVANGGGFTGQVVEFTLLEDGRVFRNNSFEQNTVFHKKLNKNETSQIFNNIQVLNLKEIVLDEPGNMYYYVKLKDDDNTHVIKWNTESTGTDTKTAKLFYQTVIQRLR